MSGELSRRETLKQAMAVAAALAVPEWMLPALAQGETDVPFTDVPDSFTPRAGGRRSPVPRPSYHRRLPHAERSVLLHPALQQARDRRRGLQAEADRPGRAAHRAVAGRHQGDEAGRYRVRLRMLREQSERHAGPVVERQVHRRAAARRAEARGRAGERTRGGVLRLRSRQRGRGVPPEHVQDPATVRAQHHARERDEARSAPGLRAQRPAARPQSRFSAPRDHAGLVRRGQREMAGGSAPAGAPVPGELPGAVVPDDARRRRERGREGSRRRSSSRTRSRG